MDFSIMFNIKLSIICDKLSCFLRQTIFECQIKINKITNKFTKKEDFGL